jgi:hypothetical protein
VTAQLWQYPSGAPITVALLVAGVVLAVLAVVVQQYRPEWVDQIVRWMETK